MNTIKKGLLLFLIAFLSLYTPLTAMNTQTKSSSNTIKKISCSICKKKLSRGNLKVHMRIHTGEKPYQCKHCGRKFNQKGSLKIHMRIHTGEKPYQCSFCDQRFTQQGNRKVHERTHTGEKPYSCNVCNKKFSQKNGLNSHKKRHALIQKPKDEWLINHKDYTIKKTKDGLLLYQGHDEIDYGSTFKAIVFNTRRDKPLKRIEIFILWKNNTITRINLLENPMTFLETREFEPIITDLSFDDGEENKLLVKTENNTYFIFDTTQPLNNQNPEEIEG